MKHLTLLLTTVVVVATIVANLGFGGQLFRFVGYIPGKDVTAHFLLYLGLGLTLSLFLQQSSWLFLRKNQVGLLLATGIVVALEEFSQAYIATRSFSYLDLAASLSGLFLGSMVGKLWHRFRYRNERLSSAANQAIVDEEP